MDIILLGSTGSIGTQTLDVARTHNFKIKALACLKDIKKLEKQAREFRPEAVCVYDESRYSELKTTLRDTGIKIYSGMDGLKTLAAMSGRVVNAVVGMIGLIPTLTAIEAGNTVALANKETLVAGGEIVMKAAKEKKVNIIPVDSEHSAIFQCLAGNTGNKINKIILTASGGPFFGFTREKLREVTKAQALSHPNWSMGAKITTDSATLMNKGLEFIEAMRLFDVSSEQIEVVIHRQSVVHSAVEWEDGSVIAQLGTPDMRIPIQYALSYPKRFFSSAPRLSLTETGRLTFEKPDLETFGCLAAAIRAAKRGGSAPAILNSANEAAVNAFLNDKIPFYRIEELVLGALEEIKAVKDPNLNQILETEQTAREYVLSKLN